MASRRHPEGAVSASIWTAEHDSWVSHYYRRAWDESRGDAHDAWGASEWLFEVDDGGLVLRQIEIYDAGPTLRYNEERPEDEFGGLSMAPLDSAEWEPFSITVAEFERAWTSA
jgi:hypothetical protein